MTKLCGDIRRGPRSGRSSCRFLPAEPPTPPRPGEPRIPAASPGGTRRWKPPGSAAGQRGPAQCSDAFHARRWRTFRETMLTKLSRGCAERLGHLSGGCPGRKGAERPAARPPFPSKPSALPELDGGCRHMRPFIGSWDRGFTSWTFFGIPASPGNAPSFAAGSSRLPVRRCLVPLVTTGRVEDLTAAGGAASSSDRVLVMRLTY